jgi:hypothetical protein
LPGQQQAGQSHEFKEDFHQITPPVFYAIFVETSGGLVPPEHGPLEYLYP